MTEKAKAHARALRELMLDSVPPGGGAHQIIEFRPASEEPAFAGDSLRAALILRRRGGTRRTKSSAGWCFSLHVYPDEGIHRLEDWMERWATGEIRDEYGDTITADEMRRRITDRSTKNNRKPPPEFHRQNHSQDGPRGLLRHQIDGRHCIGHGEGTWDHLVGEFS